MSDDAIPAGWKVESEPNDAGADVPAGWKVESSDTAPEAKAAALTDRSMGSEIEATTVPEDTSDQVSRSKGKLLQQGMDTRPTFSAGEADQFAAQAQLKTGSAEKADLAGSLARLVFGDTSNVDEHGMPIDKGAKSSLANRPGPIDVLTKWWDLIANESMPSNLVKINREVGQVKDSVKQSGALQRELARREAANDPVNEPTDKISMNNWLTERAFAEWRALKQQPEDKPLVEMATDMAKYATEHPKDFLKGTINGIGADPYIAFIGATGAGAGLARAARAGRVAEKVAETADLAATNIAAVLPATVAHQTLETGSPAGAEKEALLAAAPIVGMKVAGSAVAHAGEAVLAAKLRMQADIAVSALAKAKERVPTTEATDAVVKATQDRIDAGAAPEKALADVLESMGLKAETAERISEDLRPEPARDLSRTKEGGEAPPEGADLALSSVEGGGKPETLIDETWKSKWSARTHEQLTKLGEHNWLNGVDSFPWGARSKWMAKMITWEKYLTPDDIDKAVWIQKQKGNEAGLTHLNDLLRSRSEGRYLNEVRQLAKELPSEMDFAEREYGESTRATGAISQREKFNVVEGRAPPESDATLMHEPDLAVGQRGPQQPRRQPSGATYGEGPIRAELRGAARQGLIPQAAVDLAEWLIGKNKNVLNGLGLRLMGNLGKIAGFYDSVSRVVGIAMRRDLPIDTIVHEIHHHAERMMPPSLQRQIAREWVSRLETEKARAEAAGEHHIVSYLEDSYKGTLGDNAAKKRASEMLKNDTVPIDTHYQYFNPSEFWTMNSAAMVSKRSTMPAGFANEAKQWMGDFTEKLRHAAGLRSDAPLIRGLHNTLTTKGIERSPDMIRQAARDMLTNPSFLRDIFDVKALPAVAGASLAGGLYAAYNEEDWNTSLAAAVGAGTAMAIGRVAKNRLLTIMKDQRYRANNQFGSYFAHDQQGALQVRRFAKTMAAMVPKEADRIAITLYREGNHAIPMTPKMLQVAQMADRFFAAVHAQASGRGVLSDKVIENYVTHLWTGMDASKSLARNLWSSLQGRQGGAGGGMSPHSRFARQRVIPSYAEGIAKGLIPKTLDIAKIVEIYGTSMNRTLANDALLKSLQKTRNPNTGKFLVIPDKPQTLVKKDMQQAAIAHQSGRGIFHDEAGKAEMQDRLNYHAPGDYVQVNHPQLEGLRVDPDIVPQMRALFGTPWDNPIANATLGLSIATKALIFAGSLFHAKSLLEAAVMSGFRPIKHMLTGEARRQLRGDTAGFHLGDALHDLVGKGFMIGERPLEGRITPFLDALKLFETRYPVAGMPAKVARLGTQFLNDLLWDKIQPTIKTAVALAKYEGGLRRGLSKEQAASDAARFANNTSGGQDLFRSANAVDNYFGRNIAMGLVTPGARKAMQTGLVAPDWLISTVRSFTDALPGIGTANTRWMARAYIARAAFVYLTVANAWNQAASGHPIWENDDKTMIDNGDGTKTQMMKHALEVVHAYLDPNQFIANKLSVPVAEAARQILGVEYLSTKGAPPMDTSVSGRIKHALKATFPITANTATIRGPMDALSGAVGFPIYGSTKQQAIDAAIGRSEASIDAKVAKARREAKLDGKDPDAAEERVRKRNSPEAITERITKARERTQRRQENRSAP